MRTYQYRFIGQNEQVNGALALLDREIKAVNIKADNEIPYGGNAGVTARDVVVKRHSFNDSDRAILCAISALFPEIVWEVLDARGKWAGGPESRNYEIGMPVYTHWKRRDYPGSWEDLKAKYSEALSAAFALAQHGKDKQFLAMCIYTASAAVIAAQCPADALKELQDIAVFDSTAGYFGIVWGAAKASLRSVAVPLIIEQ